MHLIKKIFLSVLVPSIVFAALPPQVQKQKDKEQMMKFLYQYPKIKNSRYTIDTNSKTIRLDNCIIYFEREKIKRAQGWVGPASDLVYKNSTCDLGERVKSDYNPNSFDLDSEYIEEQLSDEDLNNLEDVAAGEMKIETYNPNMTLEEYCLKLQLGRVQPDRSISDQKCKEVLDQSSSKEDESDLNLNELFE